MIAALAPLLLATAQTQPQEQVCTARNAIPADVRRMAREPERWLGRCARLEGYVSYNRFYSDVAGYYRYVSSDYADHRNDGWLGLYPRRRYGFRGPMQRGSVVGIVHDCETDRARAEAERPDSIIMMTGFCHYRYGLVLNPASFRSEGPAEFERQMGEQARRSFGDLQTEAEAGPVPREVAALAERFATAVLARDERILSGLVELLNWDERPEQASASARRSYLLGEGDSPLADLRSSSQRIFFREPPPSHGAEEEPFRGWYACFCRTADCTAFWPISTVDATAAPERPYWCISIYGGDYRIAPDRVGIQRGPAYPLEPAATAFRRPF